MILKVRCLLYTYVENLDPVSLIRNMVDRVIDTGCEVHEEICDSLALSLAKAAAIRPGKILSGEEMDNLLASLFSCQESNLTQMCIRDRWWSRSQWLLSL